MKKTVATIRDVAAAAGVSTATVSKFVNGTQRFSSAVEARLSSTIEELGYRSNPMAQSMITGRTKAIGLSVLDIANPHYASVVKGANRVAQAHGYTVLLVDTEETPERETAAPGGPEPARGRHDRLFAHAGGGTGLAAGAGPSIGFLRPPGSHRVAVRCQR